MIILLQENLHLADSSSINKYIPVPANSTTEYLISNDHQADFTYTIRLKGSGTIFIDIDNGVREYHYESNYYNEDDYQSGKSLYNKLTSMTPIEFFKATVTDLYQNDNWNVSGAIAYPEGSYDTYEY